MSEERKNKTIMAVSTTIPEIITEREKQFVNLYQDNDGNFAPDEIMQGLAYGECCTDYYNDSNLPASDIFKRVKNTYLNIHPEYRNNIQWQFAFQISAKYDAAICVMSQLWDKYKIIYKADKHLAEDLLSEEQFLLKASMLKHMRYPIFYIDVTCLNIEGIKGMFIDVRVDKDNEDDVNVLICPVSEQQTKETAFMVGESPCLHCMHIKGKAKIGKEKDLTYIFNANDFNNNQIAFYTPVKGVSGLYNKIMRKVCHRLMINETMNIPTKYDTKMLYIFTYQFLTFLCLKEPDMSLNKVALKQKERAIRLGKSDSVPEVWDVGARYGEIIRTYEAKNKDNTEHRSMGPHRSPRPHARRGHWQHFWKGKGRTVYELSWCLPTLVNVDKDHKNIATVQEVTDIEPKGSKGEALIKEYLSTKHVIIRSEHYIAEIGRRYDFQVREGSKQMIVEFDGEQHFKPVKKWGDIQGLKDNIKADTIKTKWCEDNKIPLLRIRYDQKPQIPEMIDDLLNNPDKYLHKHNTFLDKKEYYKKRKKYKKELEE